MPLPGAVGHEVTADWHVLGMWIGKDGEGAKYWMNVFAELHNRGVTDVCFISRRRPARATGRDHGRVAARDRPNMHRAPDPSLDALLLQTPPHRPARALRSIYQAPTLQAGEIGQRYPAIPRAWRAGVVMVLLLLIIVVWSFS